MSCLRSGRSTSKLSRVLGRTNGALRAAVVQMRGTLGDPGCRREGNLSSVGGWNRLLSNLPVTRSDRSPSEDAEVSEINIRPIAHGSGWVQAPDYGAPASRSDFAVRLILLPLIAGHHCRENTRDIPCRRVKRSLLAKAADQLLS